MNEIIPGLEQSEMLAPLLGQVRRANGSESVTWQTGSRIDLLPTSESAGHGLVLDLAVLDEIFADHDNRREAALLPAMATKPDAQMLTCSTAGTAASVVYNRKVRSGRNAVAEGHDSGLAYFEWSAPEGWDPTDDAAFAGFHPAVGHTITVSAIRQARETFAEDPSEFARAYGNRPQLDGGDAIPETVWRRVVERAASADPDIGVCVGVDVSPERDTAAIAVCDAAGVIELAEYDAGVGWVVDRAAELAATYHAPVVFDARGPAGSVEGLSHLAAAEPMSSMDVVVACGSFYDAIADGGLIVRQDDALDRAVRGLVRKTVGDAYVWSRRASSKDVTPLYAATLAYAAAKQPDVAAPAGAIYVGVS